MCCKRTGILLAYRRENTSNRFSSLRPVHRTILIWLIFSMCANNLNFDSTCIVSKHKSTPIKVTPPLPDRATSASLTIGVKRDGDVNDHVVKHWNYPYRSAD